MEDSVKLMEALKTVEADTTGAEISVEDVVETLNHRGFGTILLIPPALTILPTGMIPGVPAVCAALVVILAAQMATGRENPWLPGFLKKMSIRRHKFRSAIRQAKPYIKTIDSMTHPRLEFLNNKGAQMAVALLCIGLGLMIAGLGFIPFVPAILSLPIFFFALGLSARDGVFTAIGFILTIGAAAMVPFIFKTISGA